MRRPKQSAEMVAELWYQRLSTPEERKFDREVERFWRLVDKTATCWLWTGTVASCGYGVFRNRGELYAHRYAYLITKGAPGDLIVRHTCDNPLCVRPDHLVLGTHRDNALDRVARGRASNGGGNRFAGEINAAAKIGRAQAQAVLDHSQQGLRCLRSPDSRGSPRGTSA